ncbi:disease resistance protein [Dorcoceras hygrometricum]|uniref:Disease resistance protein n=1 Tax=Dorcoceras hygrometricum TaxID=472368 RepID=A0A2Z7BRX1_9LAMI|nr:disease resistance protein [Dorcoceras hygrometricum]
MADPRGLIDKQQLMAAMETDGLDKALTEAFGVLSSKSKGHVSADIIRRTAEILGVHVLVENIDDIIRKEARTENDEIIDCGGFIRVIKNIWKSIADSAIKDMEKAVDEFIPNKAHLENIRMEFIIFFKCIWKREADKAEEEIRGFISKKAEQENDGNRRGEFIDNFKDIWKLMAHSMKREIDAFNPNVTVPQNFGNIHRLFIRSLGYLLKRVVDSTIIEVQKAIDELITKMTEVENDGNVHEMFISDLKVGSNVSVALLRHLVLFLGGNLADEEIVVHIMNNVDNDGPINRDEFIQIIRVIWKTSADYLSKAMGQGANPEEARRKAFAVLRNPLDDFVSATILRAVMLNLSENLDFEELYQAINLVKASPQDERIPEIIFPEIIGYVQYLIKKYPLDKIYGVLTREKTRKVVLSGESGVGKTWMATKIAGRATNDGTFDFALWMNLKGLNLRKIIAHQLSLLSESDDMETEKVKEVVGGDKKKDKSLGQRILEALKDKKVLLVFDGVNSCEELEKDLSRKSHLLKLLGLKELNSNYKVLITTSDFDNFKQEYKQEVIRIEVRCWTTHESESFLSSSLGADRFSKVKDLANFYIKRSKGLPAEILIIARTLSHFMNSDEGLKKLQGVEEVVLRDTAHDYEGYCNIEKLFIGTEVVPKFVLVDCYGSETPAKHFLRDRDSVHYNELISYWLLEGHLGHFSCIEDAYEEGHRVLMELLDCGILKPLKAGYLHGGEKEEETEEEKEKRKKDKEKEKKIGERKKKKAKKIAEKARMKEEREKKDDEDDKDYGDDDDDDDDDDEEEEEEVEKMSTLLLDGDRTGEVSDSIFDSMEDLENLAIFDPTQKPFPLRMSDKWNLRFLVLRGCEFLTMFNQVFESIVPKHPDKPPHEAPTLKKSLWEPRHKKLTLKRSLSEPRHETRILEKAMSDTLPIRSSIPQALSKLIVLEISGPSSLKTIPTNLFDQMEHLKSLNMSSLQMELLPESFYNLTTIEILILKGCSSLKRMESLKKFEQLQLLDLSGATSLEAFKDKSFSENTELRIINLSQTRIAKFPLVNSLMKLQYLSLSKCPSLIRVRKIGSVKTLCVFDISGSKNVEQLLDPGLKNLENLFALNVSGTAIRRLPSTIGKPHHLYLRDCSNLKQLPPIETLSEVRVLDLSGSALLDDIKPKFIESLKNLVRFNLLKTGVVHLPSLSSLVNLRYLLVSQCRRLEKLEGMESLIKLEVLDLSGCKALSEIEDQSFDKMVRLHSLDLSETPLEKLPSLSNLQKLRKLNLRGCTKLTNIPGLEVLPVLEDLDVTRTTLKVPELKNPNCRVRGPKPSSLTEFNATKIRKDLGLQQHIQAIGESKPDGDDKTELTQEKKEMHPTLLEDSLRNFHFFVYPVEEAAFQVIDKDLLRDEYILRNILLGNFFPEDQERCLEIRGFREFPKFLGQLLEHAEMVVLIDNSCIQFLTDLGADKLKKMKVCWIERCNEMEYVTDDQAKESADILTENIEILWVSEAAQLKSICKGTLRGIGFRTLTSLYLEYCPELSQLCYSYEQLSGLKNLHIKYCPKLVKLFDDDSPQLSNLQSLHLLELPALEKISCGMKSLRTSTVAHCPSLEYIFDLDTSTTNLECLEVKSCKNLRTILKVGRLPSHIEFIQIGCPNLSESEIPESSAPRNP